MKILVVDDVGFVRCLLEQRLTKSGYLVVTAEGGHKALDLLRRDAGIRLVLTDIVMPSMDGLEFFKAAQRVDRFNDDGPVPPPAFIFMTALRSSAGMSSRDVGRLREASTLGINEVLQKPIDFDDLLGRLAKHDVQPIGPVDAASECESRTVACLAEIRALAREIKTFQDADLLAQARAILAE